MSAVVACRYRHSVGGVIRRENQSGFEFTRCYAIPRRRRDHISNVREKMGGVGVRRFGK
jgi:hypothetical protein